MIDGYVRVARLMCALTFEEAELMWLLTLLCVQTRHPRFSECAALAAGPGGTPVSSDR